MSWTGQHEHQTPTPDLKTPAEVIREHIANLRQRVPECVKVGNALGEAFLYGRIAGLESALRALGVNDGR